MTTSTPVATPAPSASAAASPTPARRGAAVVLFVLLLAALVARTVFLAWEPPFDGAVQYDDIAPLGDAYWTMHIALGSPGFAITWVATAIFVALLARGRSAVVTLAAASVIGVAGVLFALVITAESLPFAYAADTATFPEVEGRALFDAFNAQLALLVPAIVGTQAAIALGMLVFFVVAIITRAVPRWLSIAGIVYLMAFTALPIAELGGVVLWASELVQVALLAAVGWFGMRAVARRPTA